MDKYIRNLFHKQPNPPNHNDKPCWKKYLEDNPSHINPDLVLRILMHRMFLDAAPPAETWNKIIKRARAAGHTGFR